MATNEERMKAMERADMPLLADHYRRLSNRENSSSPKERTGGLGSNKGAARYKNTSAEDRAAANADGRFGYFDEANKRYVPAFIDAMDGGGRDTSGDMFKGGGPLSGILNDLGVKPYGSERERMFVSPNTSPIVQAVSSVPSPSYANMNMGEAGRGSMPADTPLPYANMNMGEAGRGSMPAATSTPTNLPSDPATSLEKYMLGNMESYMLGNNVQSGGNQVSVAMQQARNLAARSGLNFDMMPQEQKAQYINAVMSLN